MRPTFTSIVAAMSWLGPASALGQPAYRELRGELFSIEVGEQTPKFFGGVKVSVAEFGAAGLTTDEGLFRVKLPAGVRPGDEVKLRHDKKGYAICLPLFGKQVVYGNPNKLAQIRLLREGFRPP